MTAAEKKSMATMEPFFIASSRRIENILQDRSSRMEDLGVINAADGEVNKNIPFIFHALSNDERIEDILLSVV